MEKCEEWTVLDKIESGKQGDTTQTDELLIFGRQV
jgi:hypothetical protein